MIIITQIKTFEIYKKICYNNFMRIIAGKFKGKQLKDNPYNHIRPTADKVKQALFTKLQFDIPNARVLDLFCGTGALGIEAISRGAREVVFVDVNDRSVRLTKENLALIKSNAKVIKGDANIVLGFLDGEFDLILIDPPYQSGLYEKILKKIAEKELLSEDGTIVCEHSREDEYSWDPFEVYDEKDYGTKTLTYLRRK